MNLLKVLMLVFCAASLSFLLPAKAHAVDHPWDDHSLDSSHTAGDINTDIGGPKPYVPTVIESLRKWARGLFWEVHEIFTGGTREETKGTNVDNGKRPVDPVTRGKYK
jgi:hypothetical protein